MEDGKPIRLGGVWDNRKDPEGIYYGDDLLNRDKAANVARLMEARAPGRLQALGWVIQPVNASGVVPADGSGKDAT